MVTYRLICVTCRRQCSCSLKTQYPVSDAEVRGCFPDCAAHQPVTRSLDGTDIRVGQESHHVIPEGYEADPYKFQVQTSSGGAGNPMDNMGCLSMMILTGAVLTCFIFPPLGIALLIFGVITIIGAVMSRLK